jgi:hypothetical protein
MTIKPIHMLAGVALAAVIILAKVKGTMPTMPGNRAAQARADDYRARLWGSVPPDFYV